MALIQPVPRPAHERATVVAAAVSVLLVLGAPLAMGRLLSLSPPDTSGPDFTLTQHARLVARLPGANVLRDRVILFLTPGMHPPVFSAERRVPADLTAAHTGQHTAGDLYWWITHGIARSGMPPFGGALSEAEQQMLLQELVRPAEAPRPAGDQNFRVL